MYYCENILQNIQCVTFIKKIVSLNFLKFDVEPESARQRNTENIRLLTCTNLLDNRIYIFLTLQSI